MLLTCKQAAAELGVTSRTLARWRREGKIDPSLITEGGQARYEDFYIEEKRKELKCRVHAGTFRGSHGEKTASRTPTGTTTKQDERVTKALEQLKQAKLPDFSVSSSLAESTRPAENALLD